MILSEDARCYCLGWLCADEGVVPLHSIFTPVLRDGKNFKRFKYGRKGVLVYGYTHTRKLDDTDSFDTGIGGGADGERRGRSGSRGDKRS